MTAFPSPFFLSSSFLLFFLFLLTSIPRPRTFPVSASSYFMKMLFGDLCNTSFLSISRPVGRPITRLAKNTQPTPPASSKREMLCAFHPSSFSSPYLAPSALPLLSLVPSFDAWRCGHAQPSWLKENIATCGETWRVSRKEV
ncbi:hypothetical protein ASPBRDRAFT_30016 [Aspergillus brasiliensis CBS 101740]|uniref:Secreted protein n=1 Tax=Aspergillus brasiliensis (strain CBS 101740 / IMI 381727 / IBT 21946) TaxID=767769 RepID=A0A1L9UIT3_ASPBC|nr:hypothetical protein ASPBRDRAFT_30016 [Aspergillus brasiliensis CBS 101740]